MASKDAFLPKRQQSILQNVGGNNQFSNLNLNQNHKCLNQSFVQSNSKSLNNIKSFVRVIKITDYLKSYRRTAPTLKIDSKVVDAEKLRWHKSSSNILHSKPFKSVSAFDKTETDGTKKRWKNESSNATTTRSSTLSLHIAAYKNYIESGDTVTSDKDEGLPKNLIEGQKQVSINSALGPFEFPRQQTDDESEPSVMHFTASQQLHNLNQLGSSNDNQQRTQNAVCPALVHFNQRPPTPSAQIFDTGNLRNVSPMSPLQPPHPRYALPPTYRVMPNRLPICRPQKNKRFAKPVFAANFNINRANSAAGQSELNLVLVHIEIMSAYLLSLMMDEQSHDPEKEITLSSHELLVNNMILNDAYVLTRGFGVEGLQKVYDNRAMLYTSHAISAGTFEIPAHMLIRAHPFRNEGMGFLDLNNKKFYHDAAATGQEDHELRTFYELLAVQGSIDAHECMAIVSSEMYLCCDRRRQEKYVRGITFLNGFKKNARMVQEHCDAVMKFVLDPVSSAFYGETCLAEAYHEVSRGDYSNPAAVELFLSLYRNVRVCLSFKKSKILRVQDLSREKLENLSFDRDGVQVGVLKHFAEVYGFVSEAGQLPALEVRFPNGQRGFYSLDCLDILKCQKVPMAKFNLVSATLHDNILKRNAVKAPVRFQKTADCLALIEKYFRVCYSPVQMIHLDIRGKPQIVTGTGALLPDAKARFNLRGHRYHDPSSCKKWKVLNGSSQNIQEPIRKLMIEAQTRGLDLAQPEINSFNAADFDNKDNWTAVFDDLLEYGYAFVLLINPRRDRNPKTHHMYKCCELIYGVQTQHVHLETLQKPSCHENIVHKVNVKLAGLNYNVRLEPCSIEGLFYEDRIFVVGYDVAHSLPSSNIGDVEPSVVGVAYKKNILVETFRLALWSLPQSGIIAASTLFGVKMFFLELLQVKVIVLKLKNFICKVQMQLRVLPSLQIMKLSAMKHNFP